jgi:hypothetical protein
MPVCLLEIIANFDMAVNPKRSEESTNKSAIPKLIFLFIFVSPSKKQSYKTKSAYAVRTHPKNYVLRIAATGTSPNKV